MPTLRLVKGDSLPRLVVQFKDRITDEVINITGCTAKLCYRLNEGATIQLNLTPLNPPEDGKFAYQLTGTEFSAKGIAEAQGELKSATSKISTSEMFVIEVEEKL